MSKTSIVKIFESKKMSAAIEGKHIANFRAGDTVSVKIRNIDGTTERLTTLNGVCIARGNKGINSYFIVRKISGEIGVNRVVHLYSPLLVGVDLVKQGKVRRAKLFYLSKLSGKKARIKERVTQKPTKK